jgi:hypothetical protein
MQVWSTNGGWFQQFKYSTQDMYLRNFKDGRVLEITNYQDGEGQNVGVGKLTYQLC